VGPANLINPDNPPSGPYGGTSIVWFPTRDSGSLIDLGIGTRGLAPDEGILTRPGHRRRINALRRYLARKGLDTWVKQDPSALGVPVPRTVRDRYPGFEHVFRRYGAELYACAAVPRDPDAARFVVQAFLDLYARERGWQVMKAYEGEYDSFHESLSNGACSRRRGGMQDRPSSMVRSSRAADARSRPGCLPVRSLRGLQTS
jgi:5-methylcytosine-specific restriction enzyme B